MKHSLKHALLFGVLLLFAGGGVAAPITFNFTMGGFESGGSVSGSFTGEDLNGDGYISSFPFSQDIDFTDNMFSAGVNEVISASATYNGSFDAGDAGDFGGDLGVVTTIDFFNDLTDITDELFPGFPMDLFFVLNFALDGDGLLGNDPFEGILLGDASVTYVFGAGPFLPIPENQDFTDAVNELPGGASVTAGLILNNSGGEPCTAGLACGVVHSVVPDPDTFLPIAGGADLSFGEVRVSQVPLPPSLPLLATCLIAMLVVKLKNSAYRR